MESLTRIFSPLAKSLEQQACKSGEQLARSLASNPARSAPTPGVIKTLSTSVSKQTTEVTAKSPGLRVLTDLGSEDGSSGLNSIRRHALLSEAIFKKAPQSEDESETGTGGSSTGPTESPDSSVTEQLKFLIQHSDAPAPSSEKGFVLVGEVTSHFVSHKLKLPRMETVDEPSAFDRLKGSRWEGKFSKVLIAKDGSCFYGEPFPGRYSEKVYPLIVSRDGVWIAHDPRSSPVVLGSSHGEGGTKGPLVQEGRTIDLMNHTGYKETTYTGSKPGELNLLKFSQEEINARGATEREGWWLKINKPFIEESVQEKREIVIFSKINNKVTRRENPKAKLDPTQPATTLTAFGHEMHALGGQNCAFHPASGRAIYGEEIGNLLRQGAKLVKTDQGVFEIDTSTIKKETEAS